MAQLTAYLHFNGDCKQGMEFYKSCFGGELKLLTVAGSPMAAHQPAGNQNKIIHSLLTADGITLMASDWLTDQPRKSGNTISLCLVCKSEEETQALFSKLSAWGTMIHPLKEEFFGTYGDFDDKFGFHWMFQFSKNPM